MRPQRQAVNAPSASLAERLAELIAIVDPACAGGVPGREIAQRYVVCRQALLAEAQRSALPGFLIQCVSIDRFVDFITLFHPDVTARRLFLSQQFGTAEAIRRPASHIDIFNTPL